MSTLEMITIRELLRDPQYKEFFLKSPQLPEHYTPAMLPWRLFVQKEGETKWRAKRFGTYKEAFDGMKRMLPVAHDAAINCPALSFIPPVKTVRIKGQFDPKTKKQLMKTIVWKPRIEADMADHTWCGYCRRPTIFRVAAVNVTRKNSPVVIPVGEPALRCSICGASERIINLRSPLTAQKWDENKPYIARRVA